MLQYAFPATASPAGGDLQLRDKTVVITGASSGIGRACAVLLARAGARLVLAGRRRDALEETADQAGGGAVIEADLAVPAGRELFCERVASEAPGIGALIHNAGVGIHAASFETDPDLARQLMALNFLAPVEITRRLLPLMQPGGSIVAINSIAGKVPIPGMGVYSASKHALGAYADILRMETAARGIHVLSVCPGYVTTPFVQNMLQGASLTALPGRIRFGITAERCAEAVLEGIRKRKRTVVVPRIGWALIAAERLFPAAIHGVMARHLSRRGER